MCATLTVAALSPADCPTLNSQLPSSSRPLSPTAFVDVGSLQQLTSGLALLACFSEHSPPQVAFWPQAVWLANGSVPKLCKPGAPEVLCDFKMPELLHVTAVCNLLSTVQI